MKTLPCLLLALGCLIAARPAPAQPSPAATNRPPAGPVAAEMSTTAPSIVREGEAKLRQTPPQPARPNERKTPNGVVSGVLVQATQTDNPLQLVNPAAPAEHGDGADNFNRDPVSGTTGIKLFSFSWLRKERPERSKKTTPASPAAPAKSPAR